MMADPSAAAAASSSSSGEETTTTMTEEDKKRRTIEAVVFFCLVSLLIWAVMTWAVIGFVTGPAAKSTPGFSVMVSDIVGGLDPELSPLIQPDLDLTTLRVDNPTDSRLCVDQGASAEVKAALLPQVHVNVMLPDQLRGVMASKLRAGELELWVQLRMVPDPKGYCRSCARDVVLHYCGVSPGHGFSPCACNALEQT